MRTDVRIILRDMQSNPPLYWAGVVMSIDFLLCVMLMTIDHRQITGVNAWLKPAKFAISTAIMNLSLSWIMARLTDRPRTRAWASRLFALSTVVDVAIIDLQAGRGTTSHFNMATPFDRDAYITMGIFIGITLVSMSAFTYALFRQRMAPAAWAWALRLGALVSLLGAASGGLMTPPTHAQLESPDRVRVGTHTVGAPDGGLGLPFLNWSTQHGDLRVPHFLGLHAMQAIPLISWWLMRRRTLQELQRVQLVWLSTTAYVSLFVLQAWQALRGQAPLRPDGATLLVASIILALTCVGSVLILFHSLQVALNGWAEVFEVRS
jgi:hypothetical protein